MNTLTEPRRCPACSAEIPANAPQGLCPKCLLLGIASTAEPPSEAGDFNANAASPPTALRQQAGANPARDNRPNPPSVEELSAAFPQLEIIELIGRGGMGFVYKARQPKLDRLVALKILPGHLAEEPSFHERFEREARVLAKLHHPLIVGVYDFGEAPTLAAGTHFYLILEYVDGVNLREAMRAGRFTPDQALAIVPQICEALQYAHSKGVLHRDIKPENILLDTDGRVKIADFGIAKVFDPEADASSSSLALGGASESELAVTRLTATGSVLGTPLYMAPEQLINPNSVDHRADIFSLGVVFYEMLTGELPMGRFAPPSEKSLAHQQIDQRIDEVVLRALAKERELRQQSAGELKTEVETISSISRRRSATPPAHVAAAALHGKTPPPVRSSVDTSSGGGGWWALAGLFIGTILATLPFVGFRATHSGTQAPTNLGVPILIVAPLMILFFAVPVWLGWRHLIRQRNASQRNGIIPALIAAYFVPLLLLDFLLYWVIQTPIESHSFRATQTHERYSMLSAIAKYVASIASLLVDGAILVATWHWVTRTLFRGGHQAGVSASLPTSEPGDGGRRLWGLGLVVLSIMLAVGWGAYVASASHRVSSQWFGEISSAQHQWQAANQTLQRLEGELKRSSQTELADVRTPAERERFKAQRKSLEEQIALTRVGIGELEGRMQVLSTAGNRRDALVVFMPVAVFAIPLGVTGLLLLLRRQRLVWTIGTVVGSLVVTFTAAVFLTERSRHSDATALLWRIETQRLDPIRISRVSEAPVASNQSHGLQNGQVTESEEPLQLDKNVCAAVAEANRLGLILISESNFNIPMLQVIGLRGGEIEVVVEPFFSSLVPMTAQSSRLMFTAKNSGGNVGTYAQDAPYPCDYIACDWTSDLPRIMGYALPPGAYDFRGDPETTGLFPALNNTSRAQFATGAVKLLQRTVPKSPATESDWQQATRATHIRIKFVPQTISELVVPDECLAVLTDDSRTLLTREAGRFTRWELPSAEPIRKLFESLTPPKYTDKKVEVQEPPERDQGATRQQDEKKLMPERVPLDPPDEGPLDATLPENAQRLEQ